MSDSVLAARELYRFFHAGDDEVAALRGVTLNVAAGELVAVAGPSGSGKSTLLMCCGGIDAPDGGEVVVAGRRVTRRSERERASVRARSIGLMRQSGNLVEHLTLRGNVELSQRLAGRAGNALPVLERLGIGEHAAQMPATLSGGERARASVAVAIANDPALLLADEPTGELDRQSEALVLSLLRDRARDGGAVVVVTHSDRVAATADRVLYMHEGRLVERDPHPAS